MGGPASTPIGSRSEIDRVRLEGWKAIASYLGKSIPTVRSWVAHGLPVHRIEHRRKKTVFAYPDEIDAWISSMPPELSPAIDQPEAPPSEIEPQYRPAQSYGRLILAIAVVVVLIATVSLILFF